MKIFYVIQQTPDYVQGWFFNNKRKALEKGMEEVKKNSQRLRLKIYVFGLFFIVLTLILTFFIEKISFVTS